MPLYNIFRQSPHTDGWTRANQVNAPNIEQCLVGYKKVYRVIPQNRSKDGKTGYYLLQHKENRTSGRLCVVDSAKGKQLSREAGMICI